MGEFHHSEELKLRQDIEQALRRAAQGVATADDISLLAWAAGISNQGEKHDSQR